MVSVRFSFSIKMLCGLSVIGEMTNPRVVQSLTWLTTTRWVGLLANCPVSQLTMVFVRLLIPNFMINCRGWLGRCVVIDLFGVYVVVADGFSRHPMVSTASSTEFVLRWSIGGPSAGVVFQMHPGGHAVCVETTAERGWSPTIGTDVGTEGAVDVLVRRRASHPSGYQSQCGVW